MPLIIIHRNNYHNDILPYLQHFDIPAKVYLILLPHRYHCQIKKKKAIKGIKLTTTQ